MKAGDFLTRTWLISLLLTIPFITFLPLDLGIFSVSLEKTDTECRENDIIHYYDLDYDGKVEQIISFQRYPEMLNFQIYDLAGGMYDQWNYTGEFSKTGNRLYFGDINDNGFAEVFCFSHKDDSIYLNYFEPFGNHPNEARSLLITVIEQRPGIETDFKIEGVTFTDLNSDGIDEILFIIIAGYSLEPRKLYAYNFTSQNLIQSDRAGSIISSPQIHDIDHNGIPEIFGSQKPGLNIPKNYKIPFRDNRTWLMAYDNNLQYLFPPVGYPEGLAYLYVSCFEKAEASYLMTFYTPFREGTTSPVLAVYDSGGKNIRSDTLGYLESESNNLLLQIGEERFLIIAPNGKLYKVDTQLKVRKQIDLGFSLSKYAHLMDLDNNGKREIILINRQLDEMIILSNNLMHISRCSVKETSLPGEPILISGNNIRIQSGKNEYQVKYGLNQIFFLRIPLYLAMFSVFFTVIHFSRKVREKKIQEKHELDAQLRSLELNAFSNQMDPHFTFNVFNIVASHLKKGDHDVAMDTFMKFADLIRKNLESFEDIVRPLSEELGVTKSFLDITHLRYPEKISYELNLDENVDISTIIPKMILLTHVENSIKHGLQPKKGNGSIFVDIRKMGKDLQISVKDDGIGRNVITSAQHGSTGMGIMIIEKIIVHLNMDLKRKIKQNIVDLATEEGNPSGTQVLITIPFELNSKQ